MSSATTATPTATEAKGFEISSRIHPQEYIKRFLDHNVRPDGRLLDSFRQTMITAGTISTADASAMVRLGGTTVVCGIKAEVCEPNVDKPTEGYLVPNVELSPLCSPKYRSGPPPEKAQVISEFIHQLFSTSHIVPLESLCIEAGKAVWVLYVDVVCLNDDGNILDASLLAIVVALKNLKLPKAELTPTMAVEVDSQQTASPFCLDRFPVASTFCIFNQPTVLLSDPNDTEASLARETVTIVLDTDGKVCRVHKIGGTSVGPDVLHTCFERARTRMNEVRTLIDQVKK